MGVEGDAVDDRCEAGVGEHRSPLRNGRLLAAAILALSSRSVMIWKSNSAPQAEGDHTPRWSTTLATTTTSTGDNIGDHTQRRALPARPSRSRRVTERPKRRLAHRELIHLRTRPTARGSLSGSPGSGTGVSADIVGPGSPEGIYTGQPGHVGHVGLMLLQRATHELGLGDRRGTAGFAPYRRIRRRHYRRPQTIKFLSGKEDHQSMIRLTSQGGP